MTTVAVALVAIIAALSTALGQDAPSTARATPVAAVIKAPCEVGDRVSPPVAGESLAGVRTCGWWWAGVTPMSG